MTSRTKDPRKPETKRCSAMAHSGRQCSRVAIGVFRYHGDGEIYGYDDKADARWVRVYLCKAHSGGRKPVRGSR